MNKQQELALSIRDTDFVGAIKRLCGNESLYITCLKEFLNDKTVEILNDAINKKSWDDAYTAAHALKGLAGNMGFIPLMHATGKLVILIRGGREHDLPDGVNSVNSCYRDIIDAITYNFII